MEDIFKFIGGLIAVIISFFLLIFFIFMLFLPFIIADCNRLGSNTNHETRWVFFGGGENSCLIKINGQWTPTDKWINNTGK